MSTKQNREIFDKIDALIKADKHGPHTWGIKLNPDEKELIEKQGKFERHYFSDLGIYRHYMISFFETPQKVSPQWAKITPEQIEDFKIKTMAPGLGEAIQKHLTGKYGEEKECKSLSEEQIERIYHFAEQILLDELSNLDIDFDEYQAQFEGTDFSNICTYSQNILNIIDGKEEI